MQLSEHFTLAELTASNTARKLGLDNTPGADALQQLHRTAQMLERVRAHLGGRAIIVTSGYRSRQVNEAVGGVTSSDHAQGMAADVVVPAYGTPFEVAKALASQVNALGIGQIIYESVGGAQWVHLSTRIPAQPVNRVITVHGKTTLVGIQPV
ncbi:peptidase M15 [Comamonas phosphati]|nr:peptidase M15 [Comamonas phosphati]